MRTVSLLALLLLPACSLFPEAGNAPSLINVEDLTRHWVHSYEEEQQGDAVRIFRPADYKAFPASRFRMQYIFYPDGHCQWFYLAPNDAHHFRPGAWRLDPADEDVIHIKEGDRMVSFRIVELTPDVLRMVPLSG